MLAQIRRKIFVFRHHNARRGLSPVLEDIQTAKSEKWRLLRIGSHEVRTAKIISKAWLHFRVSSAIAELHGVVSKCHLRFKLRHRVLHPMLRKHAASPLSFQATGLGRSVPSAAASSRVVHATRSSTRDMLQSGRSGEHLAILRVLSIKVATGAAEPREPQRLQ